MTRTSPRPAWPLCLWVALLLGACEEHNAEPPSTADAGDAGHSSTPLDSSMGTLDAEFVSEAATPTDAHAGDSGASFESRVRAVVASSSASAPCGLVLSASPIADLASARTAVRARVAAAGGKAPDALQLDTAVACTDRCANTFDFYALALGGGLNESLRPLAQEFERDTSAGEATSWHYDGGVIASCLSGVLDGKLAGFCVVAQAVSCQP